MIFLLKYWKSLFYVTSEERVDIKHTWTCQNKVWYESRSQIFPSTLRTINIHSVVFLFTKCISFFKFPVKVDQERTKSILTSLGKRVNGLTLFSASTFRVHSVCPLRNRNFFEFLYLKSMSLFVLL